MMHRICFIGGDGIGPELVEHGRRVLDALGLAYEASEASAGYECFERSGTSLPDETVEAVRSADAVLFGAITSPPNLQNYRSPIVRLRQELELYANLRPCRSYPNVNAIAREVDLVIVRENTEGMYSGRERREGEQAVGERVISRKGSERIVKFAYDYAVRHGRRKVAVVHKANVLRETCGLFREVALEVAKEYAQVETEEVIVDAMAMRLVKQPQAFDVIVTTNLFGDILSDEAAALIGGLGMAPSANLGEGTPIFEPAHGSAPKYAAQDRVNPCATLLSACMMLEELGEQERAERLHNAIVHVLSEGRVLTKDLGGNAKTSEMVDAIIANMQREGKRREP